MSEPFTTDQRRALDWLASHWWVVVTDDCLKPEWIAARRGSPQPWTVGGWFSWGCETLGEDAVEVVEHIVRAALEGRPAIEEPS